ncbi:aspartate-alanine antiporter [Xanthomonas sp. LMG 8992]|uniref:aspartate-alanine antiporter n=1 Tax=Xanthomonas sp. LMG 8992 TaxID=1591157 RepID=UPI001370CD99|nr:aspartate-alanine antiporter [Xanthomonas sp. LMG 8992]MXV10822.1 aspartate-alanine antiporter [Xanthomonas sp. LMG 8992]
MHAFIATLQKYPEIAIYLTIALGFWFGKLQFKNFSLGVVTSTLLAGLLIGQVGIDLPNVLQSTFFAMFLFAVGYAVGPQFIRAIRSDGMPQVVFAVLVCASGLVTAIVLGKLLHYNAPLTAGLLSGGYTNSTVLGVATDLMHQPGNLPEGGAAALALMPVAYAVTYPFGTAGSAWFLATVVPRVLKFDLPKECAEYEAAHGTSNAIGTTAYREFSARAYRWENPALAGLTVDEVEARYDHRIFIRRMRARGGATIVDCVGDTRLPAGAIVAVSGALDALLAHDASFGTELKDVTLLDFSTELLDLVVTNRNYAGQTLGAITQKLFGTPGRGVFLTKFTRSDLAMPATPQLKVQRGDVLTILGARQDVAKVAKELGYADRPLENSDMAFMGFGIVAGSLLGAITVHVAGIPLSFGTSVGAIVAGIVCGYLRSTMRTFGRIPDAALWVFSNVGLNGFIAVVGLKAASGFIAGLQQYGLTLFLAGVAVTMVPLIVGVLLGRYVFKFHPGILLGACAGARSTTAALGALQDAAGSKVPALGYTIGYAVSRLVMAVFTIILVNVF